MRIWTKLFSVAVVLVSMSGMAEAAPQSVTLSPPIGVSCPGSANDNGLTTIVANSDGSCVFAASSSVTDVNGNPVVNPNLSEGATRLVANLMSQGWVQDLSAYRRSISATNIAGNLNGVLNPTAYPYYATGSKQTIACSVNSNLTSLSCSSIADFTAGQQVMIRDAAPPATISAPAAPTITNICQGTGTNCTSGTPGGGGQTASIGYVVRAFDLNGSSVVGTIATSSTGWTSLYPNGAGGQAQKLQWSAVAGAVAYGVEKLIRGTYQIVEIVVPSASTYGTSTITWYDWGNLTPRFGAGTPWAGLYPDTGTSADQGDVLATIVSISGPAGSYTLNLSSISPAMTATSSGDIVRHDATAALQSAINSTYPNGGQTIQLPPGTYNYHVYEPASTSIIGGVGIYLNQDNLALLGSQHQNTTLTPNSALYGDAALLGNTMAIAIDGREKASGIGTLSYNYSWGSGNNLCPSGSSQCSGGQVSTACSNCSGGSSTSTFYDRAITASAIQGATVLSLSPTDAAAFNPNDDVLIRTADIGQGQPDSEYNKVCAVDSTAGAITLCLPTGKPYAQETYNSGVAGKTSTLTTAGRTNAPFGLEQVNAGTLHNVTVRDLTLNSLPGSSPNGNYALTTAQFDGVTIEDVHGKVGQVDASGNGRNLVALNNQFTTYDMSAETFPMDTKSGDYRVLGNIFKSIETQLTQITEGAFNALYSMNQFIGGPFNTTVSFNSGITNNGMIAGPTRSYNLNITDNNFVNCGAGQCIDLGGQDLWTVGDGQTQNGVLTGNTFSGAGQVGGQPPSCYTVFGDSWLTEPNACLPPLLGGTVNGAVGGPLRTMSVMLTPPAANQPQAGLTTMTVTLGPGILPQWSWIQHLTVVVYTAFNGGSDAVTVGCSASLADLVGSTSVATTGTKVDTTVGDPVMGFNHANLPVILTYTASAAPTTGRLFAQITYGLLPQNMRGANTTVPLAH